MRAPHSFIHLFVRSSVNEIFYYFNNEKNIRAIEMSFFFAK
jgi:hypothetical protein